MRKIKFDDLIFWSYLLILVSSIVYHEYKAPKSVVISEILRNPDKYHQKKVLVVGKIVNAKYKKSEWGPKYTVYKLSDGTGIIKVFADGYKDPEMCDWAIGVKVWVVGKYYKVKRVGSYVFFNQIDAEEIGLTSEEMRKFQTYLDCIEDCEKYADRESCKEFCKLSKTKAPKGN